MEEEPAALAARSHSLQIGGHTGGSAFVDDVVRKCLPAGDVRSHREASNLLVLNLHPQFAPFVPWFQAVVSDPDAQCDWLEMQNILHGFKLPAVMDLKLGVRTFGDDASPEKIASQQRKQRNTTTGLVGVRLVGSRVPALDGKPPRVIGAKWQAEVSTVDDLRTEILAFVPYPSLRKRALARLQQLLHVFETQHEFAFYGSSLLFGYDVAKGDASDLAVYMVDFAHVHPPPGDGLDESYLTGLRFLVGVFEAAGPVQPPPAPSPLMLRELHRAASRCPPPVALDSLPPTGRRYWKHFYLCPVVPEDDAPSPSARHQ